MTTPATPHAPRTDALIVGAGFAGLYMLHRLRTLGLTARIIKQADDVGGVRYWNRYPGARCDVPSLEYSYSFSDALPQEWRWSEKFAAQPEILDYLRHVSERFQLRQSIDFSTRVVRAVYDEHRRVWRVETDRSGTLTTHHLILATGPLSVPQTPQWPGIKTFRGPILHTGQWPHQPVTLQNRRVAVVGTGSSGIQAIPVIAQEAAHLLVLQRTANFVIPSRNAPMDAATDAIAKAGYAALRARSRDVGTLYDFSDRCAMSVSSEERLAEYDRRWRKGGVNFIHSFRDLLTDLEANTTAADFVRQKIRATVQDPAVAQALCPTDHPIGTKRICVGTDYYDTFNRANVKLIDLRQTPIQSVHPTGIQIGDALHPVDLLVCATGYDALTGAVNAIDIRGRDGRSLEAHWHQGPRTYLGLMSHGFPNLFLITGPGSPSVLVNLIVGLEQHVNRIADCLVSLKRQGRCAMEAEATAESRWIEELNRVADQTLMTRSNSWYLGANIPGKPRVFMPYAGGIARYRAICDDIAADDYCGFSFIHAARVRCNYNSL